MANPSEQVDAARVLLREVCALFAVHGDEAVLVGGWVPDILFPAARPPHAGSVDVDLAMRLRRAAYEKVAALLRRKGFHQGENGYQFFKEVELAGRKITARLDLLTSLRHHEEHFSGGKAGPQAVHGADIAFRDNALREIESNGGAQIRVAGIVAFLVMKSLALADRAKPKDAYDIHFCLENYLDGLGALAEEIKRFADDPLVREAQSKLAAKFRSAEDEGPRMVSDVEGLVGEARAIRKLEVYTRANEFLSLCAAT